jgi:4-alpha-glucanotransferase
MGSNGADAVWDFIRLLLASNADTAVVPMQDVLELGSEARMNLPSTTGNNWLWRMREDRLKHDLASKLREMNQLYGRYWGSGFPVSGFRFGNEPNVFPME